MLLDFFLPIFGCMAENSVILEPLVYVYMALSVFCWVLRACLLGFPYLRDLSYLAICTKKDIVLQNALQGMFFQMFALLICETEIWNVFLILFFLF
jgi:hypothetical protein